MLRRYLHKSSQPCTRKICYQSEPWPISTLPWRSRAEKIYTPNKSMTNDCQLKLQSYLSRIWDCRSIRLNRIIVHRIHACLQISNVQSFIFYVQFHKTKWNMAIICHNGPRINVVKTIIIHPSVISIFIGAMVTFPVMGGLWHCFNHMFTSHQHK